MKLFIDECVCVPKKKTAAWKALSHTWMATLLFFSFSLPLFHISEFTCFLTATDDLLPPSQQQFWLLIGKGYGEKLICQYMHLNSQLKSAFKRKTSDRYVLLGNNKTQHVSFPQRRWGTLVHDWCDYKYKTVAQRDLKCPFMKPFLHITAVTSTMLTEMHFQFETLEYKSEQ